MTTPRSLDDSTPTAGGNATNPAAPWWARNSDQPILNPKQVRLHSIRGALTKTGFALAFIAGLWWVLAATQVREVEQTEFGYYAHKQSTDALIAGCGPMYTAPLADVEATSGIVPAKDSMGISNRLSYRTVVPMFGEFWDEPADPQQSFWSRDEPNKPVPENLLRNMWDGTMVIYYTSAVPADDVETLKNVLLQRPELDAKVVPWDEAVRGNLPDNRDIAFATWNWSQSCHQLLAPALYDFREAHPASAAPGFDGTPPPVISTKPPLSVTQ